MDSKLTLRLDTSVIEKAKEYARQKNTSISHIVENYLARLTTEKKDPEEEITPLVRSLGGIAKMPEDYDPRRDYTEYLENKYK